MRHTIENERVCVSAIEMGAELTGYFDKQTGFQHIWRRDPNVWPSSAPILFPVVGRLRGDRYAFHGKTYAMPKHGFALRSRFAMEEKSPEHMTFLLKASDATRENYPFEFELRVTYRLDGEALVMEHRVKNAGDGEMPFSLGAHPGFQSSLGDIVRFDQRETCASYRMDGDKLLSDELLPVLDDSADITLTEHLFDGDALIFEGLKSKGATLLRKSGVNTRVDFGGAPCLGVWSRTGAEYVCIEPWFGLDDRWNADGDFLRKPHVRLLAPGEEFVFPVTITAC